MFKRLKQAVFVFYGTTAMLVAPFFEFYGLLYMALPMAVMFIFWLITGKDAIATFME